MKKILMMVAIVAAIIASTGVGGVQTASAFNPQPDPPAEMPDAVRSWFDTEIIAMFANVYRGLGDGEKVGIIIVSGLPNPSNNPGH